jgi:RNA polymerase sigma-70 factor (ECF subfamily)
LPVDIVLGGWKRGAKAPTEASWAMDEKHTTAVVQQYLHELAGMDGASPAAPIIRDLLARAVRRLQVLCASLLHRSYPRLTRPPLNLQTDEILSAVVERLLKALGEARPATVLQFFALANRHIRWELNDLARRLDGKVSSSSLDENAVIAPESSASGLSPVAARMLDAIEQLPEDAREVFSLVRIQGMNQTEVAQLLGVSVKTVQRRLHRGLMILSEKLADLQ